MLGVVSINDEDKENHTNGGDEDIYLMNTTISSSTSAPWPAIEDTCLMRTVMG